MWQQFVHSALYLLKEEMKTLYKFALLPLSACCFQKAETRTVPNERANVEAIYSQRLLNLLYFCLVQSLLIYY